MGQMLKFSVLRLSTAGLRCMCVKGAAQERRSVSLKEVFYLNLAAKYVWPTALSRAAVGFRLE
jgi:hypothetical protein